MTFLAFRRLEPHRSGEQGFGSVVLSPTGTFSGSSLDEIVFINALHKTHVFDLFFHVPPAVRPSLSDCRNGRIHPTVGEPVCLVACASDRLDATFLLQFFQNWGSFATGYPQFAAFQRKNREALATWQGVRGFFGQAGGQPGPFRFRP